jgi:cell division protein FtsL
VLGLVVCAVVLALAYPTRAYLAQRNDIAQLRAQHLAQQRRVAALERKQAQWQDPAYVKAQARERLQYVMPGEVAYVVIDPSGRTASAAAPHRVVTLTPKRSAQTSPWYSQLWGTVQAADGPPHS